MASHKQTCVQFSSGNNQNRETQMIKTKKKKCASGQWVLSNTLLKKVFERKRFFTRN